MPFDIDSKITVTIALFSLGAFLALLAFDIMNKSQKHPKLQYIFLFVFTVGIGTSGVVGGWLDQARIWITDGSATATQWAFEYESAGVGAVAVAMTLFWLIVMLPETLEPTPEKKVQHYIMLAISLIAYPFMLIAFATYSIFLVVGLLALMIVVNKKSRGGSRTPNYAN